MNTSLTIILSVFLLFLTSFSGFFFLKLNKAFSKEKLFLVISFSAGTLLSIACIHFFELLANRENGLKIILFFALGVILNFFIGWLFKKNQTENDKKLMWMLMPGDILHNISEAFVMVNAIMLDSMYGLWALLLLLLHEIPHKTANFSIYFFALKSFKKALFISLFTGLFFWLGAILAHHGKSQISSNDFIQSFTAGNFIFISIGAILPRILKSSSMHDIKSEILTFLAGFLLILLISLLSS